MRSNMYCGLRMARGNHENENSVQLCGDYMCTLGGPVEERCE